MYPSRLFLTLSTDGKTYRKKEDIYVASLNLNIKALLLYLAYLWCPSTVFHVAIMRWHMQVVNLAIAVASIC